jgi:ABC-type sugar transport system ATPase subunit
VLGLAGLVGSGRSEIALGIFGLDRRATGRIFVDGRSARFHDPRRAMAAGIGLVAEDRKRQGLIPEMSCAENTSLAALDCAGGRNFWGRLFRCPWCSRRCECLRLWDLLRLSQERRFVADFFGRLGVRAASPTVPITTLSGGNQQKLMLAKCLMRRCQIILLDEPTRGVDVGAKAEIHRLIDELAAGGNAILMISSELPEVLHLSTRVLVMREGRVAGIVDRKDATQEKIMQLMAGCNAERGKR